MEEFFAVLAERGIKVASKEQARELAERAADALKGSPALR